MNTIFLWGQKGAPRNVESIKFTMKGSHKVHTGCQRGQNRLRYFIYFILCQTMRASMASRKYVLSDIGGMTEKTPQKINNFWNNDGH
jgi:hypothetical protein